MSHIEPSNDLDQADTAPGDQPLDGHEARRGISEAT